MPKRRSVRRARRVQVQFWKRGEPQVYPGHTTNISTTGMFLATASPQAPGTRVRIEVLDGNHGFIVEGVVAHARKLRGDLLRITQPGMGVRFLSVEELVRELIPVIPGETEEVPGDAVAEPPEPPPPARPVPPPPARPVATRPVPPVAAPPPAPSHTGELSRPIEAAGSFSVHFLGPAEFLEVFRRDIVNGGLFVSTRYPGRLQETIRVDLHPPLPSVPPVSFRARVVQRFEPQGSDSFGPNLLAGMGVEILDLPAVLAALNPVVARLV